MSSCRSLFCKVFTLIDRKIVHDKLGKIEFIKPKARDANERQYIVAVYGMVDDLFRAMHYQDNVRSTISAAEIITVAIVAAKHFQNHHEQTVPLMVRLDYIRPISLSRFNRRLHALAH